MVRFSYYISRYSAAFFMFSGILGIATNLVLFNPTFIAYIVIALLGYMNSSFLAKVGLPTLNYYEYVRVYDPKTYVIYENLAKVKRKSMLYMIFPIVFLLTLFCGYGLYLSGMSSEDVSIPNALQKLNKVILHIGFIVVTFVLQFTRLYFYVKVYQSIRK